MYRNLFYREMKENKRSFHMVVEYRKERHTQHKIIIQQFYKIRKEYIHETKI